MQIDYNTAALAAAPLMLLLLDHCVDEVEYEAEHLKLWRDVVEGRATALEAGHAEHLSDWHESLQVDEFMLLREIEAAPFGWTIRECELFE